MRMGLVTTALTSLILEDLILEDRGYTPKIVALSVPVMGSILVDRRDAEPAVEKGLAH